MYLHLPQDHPPQDHLALDPRDTVSKDLAAAWSTEEGLAMFSTDRPSLHSYYGLDNDKDYFLVEETRNSPLVGPFVEVQANDYGSSLSRTNSPASESSAELFPSPITPSSDSTPSGQLLSHTFREAAAAAANANFLQLKLRPRPKQRKARANRSPTPAYRALPFAALPPGFTTIVPLALSETLLGFIQQIPSGRERVECPLCHQQMESMALYRHLRVGQQHAGKWIGRALKGERLPERVLAMIVIISIGTNFCRRNGVRDRVQLDAHELAAAAAFPHDIDEFSETARYRLNDHPYMRVFERPLRMLAFQCSNCGKDYARDDVRNRHEKTCGTSRRQRASSLASPRKGR